MILNIALLGGGVVGGGVTELLMPHKRINIKYILVKNREKQRDFIVPQNTKIIEDYTEIFADGEVNVLVDAMGGVDYAWEVLKKALDAGLHVVSANKAVLATRLFDIEAHFSTPRCQALFFEAAVAGGVPIINIIRRSLASDHILRVGGILNGTTNYIMSAMLKEGKGYKEALAAAQAAGYAEADPTADVMGHDARHKLIILARLAFGVTFSNYDVYTKGITEITSEDFKYAQICDCTIKLIAEAESFTVKGHTTVRAFVSPVLVHNSCPISRCDGVMNEIEIKTEHLDRVATHGPGAGRGPTAMSVVSDILELQEYIDSGREFRHPLDKPCTKDVEMDNHVLKDQKFYLRITCSDQIGIIHELSGLLAQYGVSIHSVLQTPIMDHDNVTFAVITEKTSMFNVQHVCHEIAKLEWNKGDVFCMPYRESG